MVRIAIVEDDLQAARQLQEQVEQFGAENKVETQITLFSDGAKLAGDYRPEWDLLFLDVDMPVMNGFETAKSIRETDPDVCLIFITNLAQYAIHGYDVGALDYLLKPVKYPALAMRLKRVLRLLRTRENEALILKTDGNMVRVPLSRIYYIEIFDHNLQYHTVEGVITTGGSTLSSLEKSLIPQGFVRCHNCYLVNIRYIDRVHGNTLRVAERALPVSRNRRRAVIDALLSYAEGKSV